ncbi:MAG TPA: glycosyltransferase family 39 protein [Gemmatimonadales bacterium]|nr:glycosyltransferase family 39 protein [Gemmatimonadales bacterium]
MLTLAAAVRVAAALFGGGFLAIDDHHVLVDAADRLVGGPGLDTGFMRSILYPGTVALIMRAAQAVDHPSPATQLLVVRLIQAVYSLFVVYFAYRILERLAGPRTALLGGLLTATFFVLPITSVHQFEEAMCQVPLLASSWWILKAPGARRDTLLALLSGTALGFALVVRFPLITFVVPFAAWVVWREPLRWRGAAFLTGVTLVLALQGWSNQIVNHQWGYSFLKYYGPLLDFSPRIFTESGGYPHGAPWTYAAILLAAFLPPFSLVLLAAAARGGAQLPLLGVPTLVFLVAQSAIANRQERFLLPVLPVLLVLAALGFGSVAAWFARRSWTRGYAALWQYYWAMNAALVAGTLFVYGKKDRVAPLVYVQARHDATGIVIAEFTYTFPVPVYYLGWPRPPVFVLEDRNAVARDAALARAANPSPNYVILYSDSVPADTRLLEQALGTRLASRAVVRPSLGDRLAHVINPRHNHATEAVVLSVVTAAPP